LTLSSGNSILQVKRPESTPRRREDVQRQLALWPGAERPPQELDIWQDLDPETKATVIATLARLIRKAARPKTQEDNHER
jgi:predicted Fe-S protein YdhL (DUF1289 family)